jgi:Putative zinc-finger
MRHPEEQLASYVGGTLDERERAEVDAHLRECESCRQEVELAGRARTALATLPELDVPPGTVRPGIERASPRWHRDRFRRTAWATGFAAAAGIAAILALVFVGNHPTGNSSAALASNPPRAGVAASPSPAVTHSTQDYGPSSINDLARSFARSSSLAESPSTISGVAGAEAGPNAPSPSALDKAGATPATKFAGAHATTPKACLTQGSSGLGSTRFLQLIEAHYQGSPAYIGVFLRDGVLPNAVVVTVVSPSTCTLIASAEQRLR